MFFYKRYRTPRDITELYEWWRSISWQISSRSNALKNIDKEVKHLSHDVIFDEKRVIKTILNLIDNMELTEALYFLKVYCDNLIRTREAYMPMRRHEIIQYISTICRLLTNLSEIQIYQDQLLCQLKFISKHIYYRYKMKEKSSVERSYEHKKYRFKCSVMKHIKTKINQCETLEEASSIAHLFRNDFRDSIKFHADVYYKHTVPWLWYRFTGIPDDYPNLVDQYIGLLEMVKKNIHSQSIYTVQ